MADRSEGKRHPAEVTAERLGHQVIKWADKFDSEERDMIGRIIHAFDEIAEGQR